jgi:hypothetical protein
MNTLTQYLEKYALASLEKQEKLAGLIGEHTVDIDYDSGVVRFTGAYEFPFQVLGTESDNTLTWLWAWADEQTEMSPDLVKSSLQLKAWGEKNGVGEFIVPSVDLAKADGHVLSLIASGVCEAGCYYRDDYDGGALFLLLFGEAIDRRPSLDAAGLIRQFSDLISLHELNHRNALVSYLRLKGLTFTEQETNLNFELESAEQVSAEFEPGGKVKSINGIELTLE